MDRKQIIATLESRRFWLAIIAVAEAINQAAGWHVPNTVFLSIEGVIGVLLSGDTVISAVHAANLAQPTTPVWPLAPVQTQTMGANVSGTVAK